MKKNFIIVSTGEAKRALPTMAAPPVLPPLFAPSLLEFPTSFIVCDKQTGYLLIVLHFKTIGH